MIKKVLSDNVKSFNLPTYKLLIDVAANIYKKKLAKNNIKAKLLSTKWVSTPSYKPERIEFMIDSNTTSNKVNEYALIASNVLNQFTSLSLAEVPAEIQGGIDNDEKHYFKVLRTLISRGYWIDDTRALVWLEVTDEVKVEIQPKQKVQNEYIDCDRDELKQIADYVFNYSIANHKCYNNTAYNISKTLQSNINHKLTQKAYDTLIKYYTKVKAAEDEQHEVHIQETAPEYVPGSDVSRFNKMANVFNDLQVTPQQTFISSSSPAHNDSFDSLAYAAYKPQQYIPPITVQKVGEKKYNGVRVKYDEHVYEVDEPEIETETEDDSYVDDQLNAFLKEFAPALAY